MGKAYILIFEILWSLTFRAESALALRFNTRFLDKIKKISKDSDNEPLKKAADGLVWKLIQGIEYTRCKIDSSLIIAIYIF
jgi:hypothetical protein